MTKRFGNCVPLSDPSNDTLPFFRQFTDAQLPPVAISPEKKGLLVISIPGIKKSNRCQISVWIPLLLLLAHSGKLT
ncbi:hypothetical protein D3C86_1392610 [compost metagenome]